METAKAPVLTAALANDFTALQAEVDRLEAEDPEHTSLLVDALLAAARARNTSDLHLHPTAESLEVRFRIDGVLVQAVKVHQALRDSVVRRVKVLSDLMSHQRDIPQEGRIAGEKINWHGVTGGDMRVSIYPTIYGEQAIIRFFYYALTKGELIPVKGNTFDELDTLGLAAPQLERLKDLLDHPQGMILLTGPAGSGKTTTLYASLRHLVRRWRGRRHIVTIEDPVERSIQGVSQTQIDHRHGLDFAAALRALLRQDPEIIMVGEIRDQETARIAVQAALTGHLILSTLHAGSAPEVILRLVQLGIEPYLVAGVTSAVMAQRLMRVLCPKCRVGTGSQREPFSASENGCENCHGTGYAGRSLLSELLVPDQEMRNNLSASVDGQQIMARAAALGCIGLWARGLNEAANGRTTVDELRRILTPPAEHPAPKQARAASGAGSGSPDRRD